MFRDENGGIAAATNSALDHARGEHVVFLDDDDELHPRALETMAAAVADNPEADVLYSDEDKLSPSGQRYVPTFKPDWSPDLLLSSAYLCHLLVVRRSLVEELGGLRPEFDGGQDYDLMLRATERARKVVHVPEILYHWRELAGSACGDTAAKPWAFEAGRRALESAVARRGFDAAVEPHEHFPGNFHVRAGNRGRAARQHRRAIPGRAGAAWRPAAARSSKRPATTTSSCCWSTTRSELPETEALARAAGLGPNLTDPRGSASQSPTAPRSTTPPPPRHAATCCVFLDHHLEARSDGLAGGDGGPRPARRGRRHRRPAPLSRPHRASTPASCWG